MSSESPITSVPDPNNDYDNELIYSQNDEDNGLEQDAIPQILKLNLRGVRFELDRLTLINLPESLLIAMFPNGLILGRQDEYDDDEDYDRHLVIQLQGHSSSSFQHRDEDDDDDFQVTYVDFDPVCLEYVLKFYRQAQDLSAEMKQQRLNNNNGDENNDQHHHALPTINPSSGYYSLEDKQPIIVLREELEYFCVPSQKKLSPADMTNLKIQCGQYLRQHDEIFAALQKSIARENNVAEQHLIDMLCDAGFSRDDRWGHRALEPMKTCIISMGLVLLRTTGPDNHMATAQKLLLFYRKPARKCWWDGNTVDIQGQSVRLWARRTWTLELALV
ncbi:unnamed protein product [Cunninghamella blakesleeana]